ncbi:Histone-arginine methyltransferase carm1 [Tyrophagus putrescentiae]|nr:Histone-arginine methyltransferase carm1 [Tyrophagus putrescentiae]
MSTFFEEVFLLDYDDETLSFRKRYATPLTLEVIDESDKLLIRSKLQDEQQQQMNGHMKNGENGNGNITDSNGSGQQQPSFSVEIYKDTPCSEFAKGGFRHIYDTAKANYTEADIVRFAKLVNDFKLGRKESIFSLRTDEASATQYFQFYGYLSQQQNMMQDYIRTSTYQRAILSNADDFRGKVVLDVGAGSGILSFFAVQAGARKVYAVEASSMAKHAESLVASNKLADRITVIAGKIEEISLPEQVDIIISEPMGYMLFNERMLETYLHAKKWLAPNGNMFPTRGDLHVAPFSDAQLYTEQLTKANFWFQQNFHGVDLTALRDAALKEYFYQPVVDTFDIRICIAKSNKHTVDFLQAHENDLHTIEIPLKFSVTQTDEIHGLAFWFDVAFFGSQQAVWLSTSPTQPLTHWYQVRCLIDKPLFVQRGNTVTGRVVLVSNRRQSYNVNIELAVEDAVAGPGSPAAYASNTLDLKNPYFRYTGQPIQPPPGCNTTSPSEDYWATLDTSAVVGGVGSSSAPCNGQQPQQQQQQQQQQLTAAQAAAAAAVVVQNGNASQLILNGGGIVGGNGLSIGLPNGLPVAALNTGPQGLSQPGQPDGGTGGRSGLGRVLTTGGGGYGSAVPMAGGHVVAGGGQGGSLFGQPGPSGSNNGSVVNNINNMNFPVNQSLMIGDYAAAVGGQTIPPFKPM